MKSPFISICIPAYKRINQIKVLLDSICIQNYHDFEVIVTDDSPDESIKSLCDAYASKIRILYHRNAIALGTPENWNEGIRKASGKWIKIMHDDDWFLGEGSLARFAAAAVNAEGKLVFSGFKNIKEGENDGETIRLSPVRNILLKRNPVSILSKNCIGPPSVTLFERLPLMEFDKKLKWLVDMEFYIRQLEQKQVLYIDEPLIGIGISSSQVTASSSLNPEIEIPEHIYLLNKSGIKALNNIPFYDAYWRLFRNLGINDLKRIQDLAAENQLPKKLVNLIAFQKAIPSFILRVGLFSKFIMFLSYCKSKLEV